MRTLRLTMLLGAVMGLCAALPVTATAQSASQAPPPAEQSQPNYFFPDVPQQALIYDGAHFWFRPVFAMVGDYTAFDQDDASLEQVDKQENTRELRAGRIGFTLRSKGKLGLELYSTVDYQEQRTREKPVFDVYNVELRIPVGPVRITVGKQKETISYELVALSVVLPQQERILLPFFVTRNIGVNFSGQLAGDRMTWAAGAFNDWLETGVAFNRNASEYTGRMTALPWESSDKTRYLHLGFGLRSLGPDDGMIRFAGRPESNVADKFVDTGSFAAAGARELALEWLWTHGRFSVLGERFDAWVDAPENGDPHFSGIYLLGSWFVTGESRPYIRSGGYAGGVRPKRRFGAVEVTARSSHLDITDGPIDGGMLDKWHYGVSLWASTQWKIGMSYGDADLDRAGLRGNTRMLLTRMQWLYSAASGGTGKSGLLVN